ncbi:LysR family transcriptional regulator [Tabrizicola sp.]|uniref:LysR family transcriptional regulator n=1 Tax=Tabrizicola sp. TaxID=2005166 RepID=UPI003F39DF1E
MNGSKAPSLDDLALFAAVVEAGGFTAAARKSGTPQATVSRRIAKLEQDLGLSLLDRTTRRISLTEIGRRVYDHATVMVEQANAARLAAAEMSLAIAGDMKVTAPVILGQAMIAPIVARFLHDHPQVNMQLEWTTRRVDPTEEDIDVAIILGTGGAGDLVRLRLGDTRARLYAPPTYTGAMPQHPSALAEISIVGLGSALAEQRIVFSLGQEVVPIDMPRRLMANDVRPVIAFAEVGGHIAVLPDFCAPPGWREVLPEWETPRLEVNALRTRSRGGLPKVRAFLDALRAGFSANR